MKQTPRWTRFLLPLLLIGLSGCLFSPGKNDGGGGGQTVTFKERTTIPNVLDNLITSYVDRNIDEYEKLFDQNLFTFVFDPTDVENDPDLDPQWGWAEERQATDGLFRSDNVERIELDFVKGTAHQATETDGERVQGSMKVILSEVLLRVHTRELQDGEPIILEVNGDQAEFYFIQDESETQSGKPVWRILEWRDKPIGALRGELASQ